VSRHRASSGTLRSLCWTQCGRQARRKSRSLFVIRSIGSQTKNRGQSMVLSCLRSARFPFGQFLATLPIQQMRQMPAGAHAEPVRDPSERHRRLSTQALRQPHLEGISLAPLLQLIGSRHCLPPPRRQNVPSLTEPIDNPIRRIGPFS